MPPASRGWFSKLRLCALAISGRRFYSTSPLPQKIFLRDYQEECIQTVLAYLKEGHKRLGVSLATGSGKTIIFTQLINRIQPRGDDANQTLILAHRQELVDQAARQCLNAYPDKKVEIEMGNMHASGFADITVASVQSLVSGSRISKFYPDRFKLILVDEAHHIVAPTYLKVLQHFGLDQLQNDSPALVGVSATFSRSDGVRLGSAIDQIVYHKDYVEMIEEKWLSDVIFTTVETHADISHIKSGVNGDFSTGELSRAVNTDQINDITIRSWMEKCEDRKSTLVFCVDLEHVDGITSTFRYHGVDARSISSKTKKLERSRLLDCFKNGEFPVLVNCGVFTEGTDIPNIDCVLLARPTRSRNLLIQMIGRGMRLFQGKENCHVVDMVANLKRGIVTTPTLFGLDPNELISNATADELKALAQKKKEQQEKVQSTGEKREIQEASVTPVEQPDLDVTLKFTDYDSVYDLINDSSGERHIRQMSTNSWVSIGDHCYALTTVPGKYLKIEKVRGETPGSSLFEVREIAVHITTTGKRIESAPMLKAVGETLLSAVNAADTYARDKYPKAAICFFSPWRNLPASEAQLNFLNKFRPQDDPLTPQTITKGKAGDMITKIKHGARGRFTRLKTEVKRVKKKQFKLTQQMARQQGEVRVGPVLA